MVTTSDISTAEELLIMTEEKENATPKWSTSKKGLLALVSVIVMLNSTLFVYVAANSLVYVSVGPFRFRHGLCAFRGSALLLTNLFAAPLIDYIGCYGTLLLETLIMCASTSIFVFADAYRPLRAASVLQGMGTALADTSGLVIVAGVFKRNQERIEAVAVMWIARYFGKLVLGPLTILWGVFFRGEMALATYALVYLTACIALFYCEKSIKKQVEIASQLSNPIQPVPMWKLIADGKVLVKIGLLMLSTEVFALAYFDGGRPRWMHDYLLKHEWTRIIVWLPSFVPYVLGAILIVSISKRYAHCLGRTVVLGLTLGGVCCYLKRFISDYAVRMVPISCIAFCVALVDVGLLASFAKHMDGHYKVSAYAGIYALVNIAYSLAFSVSYLVECGILEMMIDVSSKLGKIIESVLNFPFLKRL